MALSIEQVRSAMANAGTKWKVRPAASLATGATLAAVQPPGLGLNITVPERIGLLKAARDLERRTFGVVSAPPAAIDWRNKDGKNYVTAVKHQKTCNSCVAFAACGAIEARLNIVENKPGRQLDLSEAHLFYCGGGSCANGWQFSPALNRAKSKGIGKEADFPYTPVAQLCQEIPPTVKIKDFSAATGTIARKQAISSRGPVLAGMKVFEDFRDHYAGGVYRQVAGQFLGNHAICIVGYSDAQQCWIAKNSWGKNWGENGFFRIGYGECGIDSQFAFYDVEPVAVP